MSLHFSLPSNFFFKRDADFSPSRVYMCSWPELPWGGLKKSGVGRELGPWGLDNYLEVKQVVHYDTDKPWGWFIKK